MSMVDVGMDGRAAAKAFECGYMVVYLIQRGSKSRVSLLTILFRRSASHHTADTVIL